MPDQHESSESLRDRGKRHRRERILEAARALLREDSDRGFTIAQVAQRADVATATVANLIGYRDDIWAALANDALSAADFTAIQSPDYQARAWAIVDAIVNMIEADPEVFRALIRGWVHSAERVTHDPIGALVDCFEIAADRGELNAAMGSRRSGDLLASAIIGVMHQWAAGLFDTESMRARLRDLVDAAFGARRIPDSELRTWRVELAD